MVPATDGRLVCGMCGLDFAPSGHGACAGCPINGSCILACCPSCGYSMPDPERSHLARAFNGLLASRRRRRAVRRAAGPSHEPEPFQLPVVMEAEHAR